MDKTILIKSDLCETTLMMTALILPSRQTQKHRTLFPSIKDISRRRTKSQYLREMRKTSEVFSNKLRWHAAHSISRNSFERSITVTRHICLSAEVSACYCARACALTEQTRVNVESRTVFKGRDFKGRARVRAV